MIQRCFALPYYVYCLRLRCLVSFLFYSTIKAVCKTGYRKVVSGSPFYRRLLPTQTIITQTKAVRPPLPNPRLRKTGFRPVHLIR
ncbi:Uncharacterised protein [Neisseria animalis]|nr:Uncharacterised protein [Neisseria animalis]